MCANCGCGVPEDKHGDDRNIAWSEIVAAAEANDGISERGDSEHAEDGGAARLEVHCAALTEGKSDG